MNEKTTELTPEMLESLRNRISEIDLDIMELLETRVEIAKQIGVWKKENNLPIYVPEVEERKIRFLSSSCEYPGMVEAIWPVIMCYTRTVE